MPIASFAHGGRTRLGKVFKDHVIDLTLAAPSLPGDIIGFLEAGTPAVAAFHAIEDRADARIPLAAVRLLPPIPAPEKFLGIGMNYREHLAEAARGGMEVPPHQLWFNKQVSCIVGPYDDVVMPKVSDCLDFEAELAVVIGKRCRHIAATDARSVIGGYMVTNDVSVRDWQRRTPTITLGKSFDTHGPIGPWLVLDSEIADPHAIDFRMFVNGEQRQRGHTGAMIHNIFEQIALLSTVMTLKPGDILATGTPSGVGAAANPPRFLKAGDVMRVEIDGIGHIENRVVGEQV
jgi:2-keto-4-pentenoate hydratase/2-oxohepta-3-ene-1,7-dioic acid hydratase in catechol pathway